MTHQTSAGESRRSRRLAFNSAAALTIGVALLIVIGRSPAKADESSFSMKQPSFMRPDAEIAVQLLQSVAGANAVLCSALNRSFGMGSWGEPLVLESDGASAEEIEAARWIGKRHLDRAVLPVAQRAMSSSDACVRRVAARLAGNADVPRLHEALRAELQSASLPTREAALLAVGYAGQQEALPMLIALLQKDGNAEVRRLAAWAIGQIDG